MFAVALAAWKAGGGWRELPVPNIACSGIPVKAPVEEWKALAGGDQRLENALVRLHILFRDADTLGSLIDPRATAERTGGASPQRSIDDVDWNDVAPLLERSTAAETVDPALATLGVDAVGIARAADFLSRRYTLVATNVPYLTSENQVKELKDHSRLRFTLGRADLATTFLVRALELANGRGTVAVVTPQAWLTLGGYRHLREWSLDHHSWAMLARLGPRAFEGISGEVVNVGLFIISDTRMDTGGGWGMDLLSEPTAAAKDLALRASPLVPIDQHHQRKNPDSRIILGHRIKGPLLSEYASSLWGLRTADNPRFRRYFWELGEPTSEWVNIHTSVPETVPYGGRQEILLWENDRGTLRESHEKGSASIQGMGAWGRQGVAVTLSGNLPVTRYTGEIFANSTSAVWPHDPDDLPAIWAFLSSPEFHLSVRLIDQKIIVMNQTLLKVAFDRDRWRRIALEAGPLTEPSSDDPTQWLFGGHPKGSAAPLQVAVARLLGYHWPGQSDEDDLDEFADDDGIVCLPSVLGERTAAERVQEVLARAFGGTWSPTRAAALLAEEGSKKKELAVVAS